MQGDTAVYEPELGDYGLDGVEVQIDCSYMDSGFGCGSLTLLLRSCIVQLQLYRLDGIPSGCRLPLTIEFSMPPKRVFSRWAPLDLCSTRSPQMPA